MTTRGWRDSGIYFALLGLVFVVLLQATLLARVHFLGAQPDLLLVLVVCWSLLYGVSEGLLWAFLGGLLIDVVSGQPLGMSPLALMPVCFFAAAGRTSVYVNNVWLPVLLVVLATPVNGGLLLLIRQLRGVPVDWPQATLNVILPALALNLLLTLIVARVLRRIAGAARLTGAG